MKKMLIIGANEFLKPLIEAASRRCQVFIAAPEVPEYCFPLIEDYISADVRDKERIIEFARDVQINGVITDQTDMAVPTVAYIAEKMGLNGIGYDTARLFTDKKMMREKLQEMGIKCLPFCVAKSEEEAIDFFRKVGSSVIIKPVDSQGSRGVMKCKNEDEIRQKYCKALAYTQTGEVLVEKYVEGKEFLVEGMVYDHKFQNLICGDTYYFNIPDVFAPKERAFPSIENKKIVERVLKLNKRIINGFGLNQGITHSEFITDGKEIYLIETAARGGGVFISSDLISIMTGIDVEDYLLDIALGELRDVPAFRENGEISCGYLAFYLPAGIVVDVSGIEKVLSLPYVHRNQLNKIALGKHFTGELIDKTSRFAVIVSASDRSQLAERMIFIRKLLSGIKVKNNSEIGEPIWE